MQDVIFYTHSAGFDKKKLVVFGLTDSTHDVLLRSLRSRSFNPDLARSPCGAASNCLGQRLVFVEIVGFRAQSHGSVPLSAFEPKVCRLVTTGDVDGMRY